ncbi:MAG: sulfoxide reductase heme-binding subunit YedZ [Candidatus Rokubacteria bacterium]|nr:sulfoxide reductase heme-binding subunit YedZ [Candidatus Rokubacteria bacterium]
MTARGRLALKALVWALGLAPLAWLLWRTWSDDLGANPVSEITNTLGDWTLRILLTTLAVTPLRMVTGWGWPPTLRRLIGLFAFFYVVLHFLTWVVIDHFFNWRQMGPDIVKRPYITIGMLGLLTLTPLAITSTAGMIKRLGARRWKRLHRLAYIAGTLGVLHFVWLAKVGRTEPWWYAAALVVLLGVRAVDALRRRARAARAEAKLHLNATGRP